MKELRFFRMLVKQGAINLVHKLQLLEAEMMAAATPDKKMRGKEEEIFQLYDNAIVSATRSGIVQDGALANYLCFQFIQTRAVKTQLATNYFERSFEMWLAWGAWAVAKSLASRHPLMLYEGSSLSASLNCGSRSSKLGLRSRPRFDARLSLQHQVLAL